MGPRPMANCEHCGTEFPAKSDDDRFCCRGCEYVSDLISEQGFTQFYDLKQGIAVAPVKSRPFEEHDFSWLPTAVSTAEKEAGQLHSEARLDLSIEGISCVGCVWLIEKLFSRHPGAIRCAANPASGKLHLEWLPGDCDLEPFLRELCQFGYVAAPVGSNPGDHERRRLAARLGLCGAFALNTMGFSLPMYLEMPSDSEFADLFKLIAFLSATLSMLVGASYFTGRAWRALRTGSLHIDLPIALGLVSAYIGSIIGWSLKIEALMYFDFVSTFVFLMLTGRYVQTAAVDRNRRRLVRRQPVPDSFQPIDRNAAKVHRDQIRPGLEFLLQPGNALPVSAVLVSGQADFSLEWIHGEADSVHFNAGSRLPSGAILLSQSPVAVSAAETWKDSLLSKLTAPVVSDRGSPGLDRLLKTYLLAVIGVGLATFAIWMDSGKPLDGLQAMISIFVVSCPCALGVAIPLADDMAASIMERMGVFIRTATIWSRLRRVKHVIFDKTGTLTLERPQLQNPEAVASLSDEQALALARLTRGSLHPISRSLLEALGTRGQKLLATHGDLPVRETPGSGVALIDQETLWSLGKPGWTGVPDFFPAGPANPGSELRCNGESVACFQFQESLRPGTASMLQNLVKSGLSLHILSGDHPDKVRHVANFLQIPPANAAGALSPEEKAGRVRALDQQNTLFLGDGANDSLAFDAASVTGTPVVDRSLLESKADFYTLGSGLGFLPALLQTARARTQAVRAAFAFALIYNVTAVSFCATGHMIPIIAAIIMPLSSIVSIAIVAALTHAKKPIRG